MKIGATDDKVLLENAGNDNKVDKVEANIEMAQLGVSTINRTSLNRRSVK